VQLQPLGNAVQAAAQPLDATLTALPSFAADAGPALQSLGDNAPLLQRLSSGALGPVQRLAPVAARLDTFAGKLAPVTTALDSGHVFRDLLRLMFGWARTIQQRDGLGHIFGLRLTVNARDLTSAVERLLRVHPKAPTHAHAHARTVAALAPVAAAPAAATAAPSPLAAPVSALKQTVQHVVGPATAAVKSAAAGIAAPVQSTDKQLQGLLSYLLGR
jgi:hypothetical protein